MCLAWRGGLGVVGVGVRADVGVGVGLWDVGCGLACWRRPVRDLIGWTGFTFSRTLV